MYSTVVQYSIRVILTRASQLIPIKGMIAMRINKSAPISLVSFITLFVSMISFAYNNNNLRIEKRTCLQVSLL